MRGPRRALDHSHLPETPGHRPGGDPPYTPKDRKPFTNWLDAGGSLPEEEGVDKATWDKLDAVVSEHAEKTSTKHPSRRLTLQFCTDEEGATGERDGWARDLVGSLLLFPKVGDVEYVSRR